ncbi:MFS transporter [Dyella flava]|uniref:MFS transporter n=1 Tax=Dyella flava TaxID=1920170 RepID=A0ABS2K2R0_9GAMM|nr:MFS transporter [Dyella flava]MBM7125523.1 MFS transporter [Dyella flava]GLQ51615.1 MFS transporter [Dyella flava]
MTTSVSIAFRRSEIVAALAVGCVALMMLGLQPALLGDLIEQHRISLEGVGIVAMGEIFSLGIGVVLAEKFLPLDRLRPVAVLGSLLLVTVNLLTLMVHGDAACVAMRIAAGLLEASLFWITTVVIVRSREPDRLAGIFLTAQTLTQALVALALARLPLHVLGWQAGFIVLAAVCITPLLVTARLPRQVGTHSDAIMPSVVSWRGFFALLVPFAHLSAIGTLWAYLEPLSKHAGIVGSNADALVALVLLMQVIGGSIAAMAVRRWRVGPTLVFSAMVIVAIGIAMHRLTWPDPWGFAALCAVFGFAWLFQMPFHIRLAFDIDPRGRIALLVPAAQLLGSGFGPLAASFSVHGEDVQRIPLIAAGFAVCVVVALLLVKYRAPSGKGSGILAGGEHFK